MNCPTCNGENLNIDYRIAVPEEGSSWYPASCNDCQEKLLVEANPKDLNKMIKLGE